MAPEVELDALTLLNDVGNRCLDAGDDIDGCLNTILEAALRGSGADKGNVQLLDPRSGMLVIRAQSGFSAPFLEFFSQVHQGSSAVCAAALGAIRRIIVEDVLESGQLAKPAIEVLLAEGVRAVQSTPLVSSTRHVVGMISTHYGRPRRPSERELRFLDLLARQSADYLERKHAERLLSAKQQELQQVADQSDALLTRCSRDLRYLFVNKPCADFLGKPPELIVGRPIREVMGEDAFQVIRPYAERVLAGERVEFETEIPYTKSGPRYMHVTYVPDVDAHGTVVGWIGTISDITSRRRLEEQLRVADRQKDQFLAMLAHELRNPLAPIRYALAAGRKGADTAEQRVRLQEVIERQVSHMTRLLDDLLDVSRITTGKFELKRISTDLTAILGSAIEAARPALEAKRHELSVDLPREWVRLEADPIRLAQVFCNLLVNAAKYTDPGGHIHVRAAQDNGEVVVSVRDDGIGIPPELMPRLFTLFTQGRSSAARAEGGLGVGLSLLKGIVELHGGRVEAVSGGPNRGSEFTVRLPASSIEPAAAEAATPARKPPPPGLKILLADDNQDAADTCAALLELSGHQVRTAYTGRAALELAQTFRPQALLLDIGLPDMNGYELAEQVRSTLGRGAVLVAVTGWGQEDDRRRAFAAGFDYHLTKPVNEGTLDELLRSVNREMR